jgi:hypothetical protein
MPGRDHVTGHLAAAQERSLQIDRVHLLPVRERQLQERLVHADAGDRDEDVDATEAASRRLDHGHDLRFVGDVDTEAEMAAAEAGRRRPGAVRVEVGGRDPGAGGGQPRRNRLPDPRRRPRNQHALAIEPHQRPPCPCHRIALRHSWPPA